MSGEKKLVRAPLAWTLLLPTMPCGGRSSSLISPFAHLLSWSHLLLSSTFFAAPPPLLPHLSRPPLTVQILFLPLLSPSPPHTPPSSALSCHCLSVGILSVPSTAASVNAAGASKTEIHLRAHWFKNTFDIGGPLPQVLLRSLSRGRRGIRSGRRTSESRQKNKAPLQSFPLKLCDWPS